MAYPSYALRTLGVPTAVGIPEKENWEVSQRPHSPILVGLFLSISHPCGMIVQTANCVDSEKDNRSKRNRGNYLSRAVRSARQHRLCRSRDGNKGRPLPSALYTQRCQGRFGRSRRPWSGRTERPAIARVYTEETASGNPLSLEPFLEIICQPTPESHPLGPWAASQILHCLRQTANDQRAL